MITLMADTSPNDSESNASGTFKFKWSWLSIALGVISIASLGTLIVVASIKGADLLSTSALALAVLAFAAQLIISLAQAIGAGQQLANVERVNANTQSALSALRAASDALISNQNTHFSDVLKAALTGREFRGSAEVSESGVSRPETDLQALLRTNFTPSAPSAEYKIMTNYPDEARGSELAKAFKELTPWEAQYFAKTANLSLERSRAGDSAGVWLNPLDEGRLIGPGRKGLEQRGLMRNDQRIHPDGTIRTWMELTPLGFEVASLLFGRGQTPDWLLDQMGGKSSK